MKIVRYNTGRYDRPRIVTVSGEVEEDGQHIRVGEHRIHRSRIRSIR